MAGPTAFQPNAFQINAFQIGVDAFVASVEVLDFAPHFIPPNISVYKQLDADWPNLLQSTPPPAFDPSQFIQVEADSLPMLRFISQDADDALLPIIPSFVQTEMDGNVVPMSVRYDVDEDWPTLLPFTPPPAFDASQFIQVETDVKPALLFSSQDVDDWPDVLPVTPPPPFDATQLPQVDETQLAFKTLVRYEDAPDVLPIFLPPFIHELQEFPKLPSNYVWLSVTWEDWLQPPAAQIVNSGPAFGRSVRLGLMFPAFR